MATKSTQSSNAVGEFAIDTQEYGYPDGPDHVLIEINPAQSGTWMAILAAGVDGRFSFDFGLDSEGIDIERAFVEGMREPVEELPDWISAVRKRIEAEMGV